MTVDSIIVTRAEARIFLLGVHPSDSQSTRELQITV